MEKLGEFSMEINSNVVFRGFNALYAPVERGYVRLIGRMTARSGTMSLIAALLVGLGAWGVARLPSAFIPTEDQGYLAVALQLPDGASLERTQAALARTTRIAMGVPGVAQVIEIAGVSPRDCNASLSSAAAAYVILDEWSVRGRAGHEGLRAIYETLQSRLATLPDGSALVLPPPPIQGVGKAAGFTMQIELRDGNFDWRKLQAMTRMVTQAAATQSGVRHVTSSYRAEVPQLQLTVDRTKAETMHVAVGDVFNVLTGYVGSSYINQFNNFGRTFQVYAQAESRFRLQARDLQALYVRSATGQMVPLGALVTLQDAAGPALISLYNFYPTATIVGVPAPGFSSGQANALMAEIAAATLPRGTDFEWTAMSYQEQLAGNQIYVVFALALLLVYLVLAAQYESWMAPLAVLCAVPLALLGPALVLGALGLANNLYTQIDMVLLIALSAKNAILIVEVARGELAGGTNIDDAAVAAARARFRPIIMTSFAFILGIALLVLSTGAGAAACISLGLAVLSGMISSTCLAVLFVPSIFVVLEQGAARWRQRGGRTAPPPPICQEFDP